MNGLVNVNLFLKRYFGINLTPAKDPMVRQATTVHCITFPGQEAFAFVQNGKYSAYEPKQLKVSVVGEGNDPLLHACTDDTIWEFRLSDAADAPLLTEFLKRYYGFQKGVDT